MDYVSPIDERVREPEPLARPRALNSEQRELVGDVADVRAGDHALLEPLERGLAVGGVHDQEVATGLEAVGDQIVDDPATLVRQ